MRRRHSQASSDDDAEAANNNINLNTLEAAVNSNKNIRNNT